MACEVNQCQQSVARGPLSGSCCCYCHLSRWPFLPLTVGGVVKQAASMASSFLYSWFYPHRDSVDSVPTEELQCLEEEEEEEICWVLGKILLMYCLAVAAIKILYHVVDWVRFFNVSDFCHVQWEDGAELSSAIHITQSVDATLLATSTGGALPVLVVVKVPESTLRQLTLQWCGRAEPSCTHRHSGG